MEAQNNNPIQNPETIQLEELLKYLREDSDKEVAQLKEVLISSFSMIWQNFINGVNKVAERRNKVEQEAVKTDKLNKS